jgi:hypothetical protein
MLEDALRYPLRGEDATTRLVVGGALPFLAIAIYLVGLLLTVVFVGVFVLPFAIVPRVFLWGYLVAVVAAVLNGRAEPPDFTDWTRLGIDGLKAVVVTVGYSLPLVAALVAFAVVAAFTGALADQAGSSANSVIGVLFLLVGLGAALYSLLLYYVLPAAIVNVVREDDLAAAFDLGTVRDIAFDGDYLVPWLVAVVVLTIGNLLALPLSLVLVGFVLRFYLLVVAAYLVTRGSIDSMNWTTERGTDPQESRSPTEADTTQAKPHSCMA